MEPSEPAHRDERRLPAAHPRGRARQRPRARQRDVLPHRPVSRPHARADPPPAPVVLAEVAAVRERGRRAVRDAALLDQAINDPDFSKGQNLLEIFADTTSIVQQSYCDLADLLDEYIEETFEDTTLTQARKMSREAARSILPNASETRIFVTGNYRAWRDVLVLRGTVHADREIRAVAVLILRELHKLAPNVFGDLKITPQGTIEQTIEVAA
ncbi:hypothetical protein GS982_31630 [Rhodococcus hoagii]|nr:hypothetical protein [Prescottella equi]